MSQYGTLGVSVYCPMMGSSRRPSPNHDPAYVKLRERLKAARVEAGLTQTELGAVFRRPHTFIHKVETGERRIDPIELCTWCKACGVDPCKILKPKNTRSRK